MIKFKTILSAKTFTLFTLLLFNNSQQKSAQKFIYQRSTYTRRSGYLELLCLHLSNTMLRERLWRHAMLHNLNKSNYLTYISKLTCLTTLSLKKQEQVENSKWTSKSKHFLESWKTVNIYNDSLCHAMRGGKEIDYSNTTTTLLTLHLKSGCNISTPY